MMYTSCDGAALTVDHDGVAFQAASVLHLMGYGKHIA